MALLGLLPRIRAARAALPALAAREAWPREQIEAAQLARLNQTWAHARRTVPHYRDQARALDLPDAFESLAAFEAAVPTLDKGLVRDAPERFLSEAALPGRWHRTGGSTGSPMRVYWSAEAHRETLRARYRTLDRWGLDVLDPSAVLWGHGASVAPGLRGQAAQRAQPLFDRLRRRLRLSAYALSPAELDAHIDRLARFRPRSLYGYSSAVGLLAARAEATGVRVSSLRLVTLTGEPSDASLRARVGRQLGADVAVEYGSVETGVMATSAPDGTLRVCEGLVHLETHPTAVGALDLVVTVLSNPSFPLLRYRIGDVAPAPLGRPAVGLSILPGVEGRRTDVLLGADGGLVHASAVERVLREAGGARRFRAHQSADGTVALTVEPGEAGLLDGRRAEAALTRLLGGREVRIERTDALPGTRAGKHRAVVSELMT